MLRIEDNSDSSIVIETDAELTKTTIESLKELYTWLVEERQKNLIITEAYETLNDEDEYEED